MRMHWGCAVWLWLTSPFVAWARDVPESLKEGPTSPPGAWHFLTRLEATTLALSPRMGMGMDEGFLQVEPLLVVDGAEAFGLNLGAPVRLRLWGGGTEAGLIRKEDWDTLSDWGQVVRLLSLGSDASPVSLWAGSLDCYSLLSGHLVRRYSNRANPDYHPAGAVLTGTLGPLYAEAFTSDVLGTRLVGAEVEVDVAHVLGGRPMQPGRYTLALSAVHDGARPGGTARPVTLAHVDGTAVVWVRRGNDGGVEAQVFAGWGGRPGEADAWGAVAGLGLDAVSPTLDVLARLEVRLQRGGFRQSYFGQDYELARFQVAGGAGVALAEATFPTGASTFGEVIVGWDAVRLGDLVRRHLRLSVSTEAFSWGRVDADVRLAAQLFHREVEVAFRGLAVGMRQPGVRYLTSGEVRWRFLGGRLYALGQGGTLLYPTPEGTLRPGAFASVGMGVDDAR
ncbi:hypothetical protein OV208_02435 [Corallococcus sp. bb12-1]|uniref:hypothetical protein n=1 Tax=Corallococcus sp. bb12-1 TaxID=2996784 RepID=UPI00226EC32E|nr:hypothetical protein [Corallococcus sp. bb12-1]MCY1040164.1 hypothetical protein [Corallococcus sp. bb12-1]